MSGPSGAGGGSRKRGFTAEGQEGSLWGDESVLYVDFGSGYRALYIYQNSSKYTLKIIGFYCMYFVLQ